ncbi:MULTISPECIES: hypothetical protein [unclassified Pseudomonas]|jgi:hypothetical protein|uniref:hypothetical protein n=1 Tax=unclassified Pseudomonas TaxID=196821 RepID=UPI0019DB1C9E|nr:hypothetical protein [Pseudomonas sp.]MBF0677127.1 hypothetical protein [Pseudomonas sp.]
MPRSDRPRFRVNADRQSASRRVRYVETNQPDEGECTICILDELAEAAEHAAASPGTAEKKSGEA